MLLEHPHNLMQKAVGWVLREVGKKDMARLIDYININIHRISPVTLSYATETRSPDLKVILPESGLSLPAIMLSRVDFPVPFLAITDADSPVSTMSGGQSKRVALAKVILGNPDLIILDEPTNHLDIKVIEWKSVFYFGKFRTHGFYAFLPTSQVVIVIAVVGIYAFAVNLDYFVGNAVIVHRIKNIRSQWCKQAFR